MSCCDTTGAFYPTALGHAGLAQLVEHLICNQGVGSSSLLTGTIFTVIFQMWPFSLGAVTGLGLGIFGGVTQTPP